MRKMATIRQIEEIKPIEGADKIEACRVDNWWVVAQKGEYSVGDKAVYCEIDSWIPHELAPFLSKGKEPREYNGVEGERLRTVRLRGQVSQGLLLPLRDTLGQRNQLRNGTDPCTWAKNLNTDDEIRVTDEVGCDVSEYLNIQKYEPPIPAQLAGQIRGNFPSFIPKTDQERIQNLHYDELVENGPYFAEEKLDGSSMTVYVNGDDEGVCSRRLDLKRNEDNTFWKVAIEARIIEAIRAISIDPSLALQGELIGEGIQGNKYKIKGHQFWLFDIYSIKHQEYTSREVRDLIWGRIQGEGFRDIHLVPEVSPRIDIRSKPSIDEWIDYADGYSHLNPKMDREGVVFRSENPEAGRFTFKSISNKFLLKGGE